MWVWIPVGNNVRVRQGALVYGHTYKFDDWVYETVFQLGQLTGDRAVIYYNGKVTGAVNVNDLILA
jgi:hypothetical protein